jgi:tetratricopeptide (TPR) repeat protein
MQTARGVMDKGLFRDAFKQIVDVPVSRPDELFAKIALMADSGVALRDASILEYGLYLLEHHSQDILAVPSFAPFLWVNIANLRANLLSLKEAEGGRRCWYERKSSAPAREAYQKALDKCGDNSALKARILTAYARLLVGLGRDWEAFGLFHEATVLDPQDLEARYGRSETLAGLAGTAPALEKDLLREVHLHLVEIGEADEGPGRDDAADNLITGIEERLGPGSTDVDLDFPKNTVVTDTEREHTMVTYALKHRLYLTPCAACRSCDRSVGDAAALGALHAIVGRKGSGLYRKTAVLTGRLTERYRALRTALIEHRRQADVPDGSDHQPHFPEVDGWRPIHPSTASLLSTLAGTGAILEGMASCVALMLGRETKGPVRIEHILGSPGAPGASLRDVRNPALHGFWDLWADGVQGMTLGYDLPGLFGSALSTAAVEELSLDDGLLTEKTLGLLAWLRDLLAYLIRMADRDARGEVDDPPLWPLQPFILP